MAWSDYSSEEVDETTAGFGARSSELQLKPGEKVQYFVTRDDVGASEPWRIELHGSIEDTPNWAANPPLRTWRLLGTQLEFTFVVTGLYECAVWIENDDIGSESEIVQTVVGHRVDGVSL